MRTAIHPVRHLRLLVVWLLALVVPLQGLAVCLLQVRGPGHAHVQATEDTLLGADFRRNLGRRMTVDPVRRVLLEAAHGHPHFEARFHYHAMDDASVRYVDGDGFGGALGDDGGAAGDGLAWFVPLPASGVRWSDPGQGALPDAGPRWTPTGAFRPRLDRPPSLAAV